MHLAERLLCRPLVGSMPSPLKHRSRQTIDRFPDIAGEAAMFESGVLTRWASVIGFREVPDQAPPVAVSLLDEDLAAVRVDIAFEYRALRSRGLRQHLGLGLQDKCRGWFWLRLADL